MGLFKSVATKAVVTVARALNLTSPDLYVAIGGQPSAAGKVVTVDTALQLDTVWACVRLLSQTIATLPLMVYRQDAAGHNTIAAKHPLYGILHDQPNADMTATEFWEAIVSNVLLWGNAYAEISRGVTGQVVALTPLRSDRVVIRRQPDGSPLFVYSWMGRVAELQQEDVLHIKGFSLDGMIGLSPIALARQTLGTAIAMEEAAAKIFANGMRPSGYMSSPTILTAQQREKTRELLERFQGSHNTGKVPLLEGGWKFEALSIPPEDGQLLESRSFSVEQICRWFDVPPIMIGHMEKSTAWGTGMEQMMLWFLTFSLRPHLERIEQAIKRDLIGASDADVVAEFKVDGLLRADSAARAALYSSLGQNGIRTRNEMRALENLPRVDGGDDLTVQSNLIPIQDLGKIATMPKDKPVEPGEAVQANPDPGGVPQGGGLKGQLPFSGSEEKAFNPNQPRRADGRFGTGGGSTIGEAFLVAESVTGKHKIHVKSKHVTKYKGHTTVDSFVAAHKKGRAAALRELAADHRNGKIAIEEPEIPPLRGSGKLRPPLDRSNLRSVARQDIEGDDYLVSLNGSKKYPEGITVKEFADAHPNGRAAGLAAVKADMRAGRLIAERPIERLTNPTRKAPEPPTSGHPLQPQFASNVSAGFKAKMNGAWSTVPDHVKDALQRHGVEIHGAANITDEATDLIGQRPRGWPAGSTWEEADGVYTSTGGRRRAIIGETVRNRISGSYQAGDRTAAVTLHETGHAVDDAYGRLSTSKSFMDAYQADVAEFHADPASRSDVQYAYFLQPGAEGPSEMFAEMFATRLGQSSNFRFPPLDRRFPRCARILDGVLRLT